MHQKQRALDADHYKAIQDEIDRLLKIRFIRESYYSNRLANLVLVIKPNEKGRTCIDFMNLNKACPKDSFPWPWIDQPVDATAGHKLLSCMDVYSRYNQIPIFEPKKKHTSFITDRGRYLKNAWATYQRLVNMMFKDLIGKSMEVYMDDMLVKSKMAGDHTKHLK